MITFHLGDLLWCTDHLDVGTVVRADPYQDENGEDTTFLEVRFSSGLTCITGDEVSHGDYRPARRKSGVWEFEENGVWNPIDFSESCFITEGPTFTDDPEEGMPPDVGPHMDIEPYREDENGCLSDADG